MQGEEDWLRAALQALLSLSPSDGFDIRLLALRGGVWEAGSLGDSEGRVGDALNIGVS